MILPGSATFTLILLILSLLCLGSWANTLKMAGSRWRFELYYYDFAIGATFAAVLAAFTFGSLGLDGFTVFDDLSLAGKRQEAFAFAAGLIFNLGNLLIVAAISLAGMSVTFPVAFGVAAIVSAVMGNYLHPAGNALLVYAGCASMLAAVIFSITAWRKLRASKVAAAAAAAEQNAPAKAPPSRAKNAKKKQTARKSMVLAVIGGILMGSFFPLVGWAEEGENGIGPYTVTLLFGLAIAFSTFVYNLFFMNLPVQGGPVEAREYFNGRVRQHLAGIAGGVVWIAGTAAALVAGKAEAAAAQPAVTTAATYGVPLVGALWGVFAWKEFSDSDSNIKVLLGAMFALLAIGIAVLSVAQNYHAH
jgi:glucose uptake protein